MALKGGVGKSTTSLHLAHTFARKFGLNVVFYDCDSQRSSSVLALKRQIDEHHQGIYQNLLDANGICTLRQQLDAVRGNPLVTVGTANAIELWKAEPGAHGSLRIVPGHRNMSEWDEILAFQESITVVMGQVNHLSGAPHHAFLATGRQTLQSRYCHCRSEPQSRTPQSVRGNDK